MQSLLAFYLDLTVMQFATLFQPITDLILRILSLLSEYLIKYNPALVANRAKLLVIVRLRSLTTWWLI